MAARNKSKFKTMTVKKVILSAVALLVAMVAIFIFMAVYEGSTKPIVSVADRLQPDPSWELVSERIEPPRILCVGGSACPSLQRKWSMPSGSLSMEELGRYFEAADWRVIDYGACEDMFAGRRGQTSCLIDGKTRDEKYRLMLSIDLKEDREWMLLYVNPAS